jgi:putative heme-binding domain-containing protein
MQQYGARQALALLEHWHGRSVAREEDSEQDALKAWQQWFAREYPNLPLAELPGEEENARWRYKELLEHLTSDEGLRGSPDRGAVVFEQAACVRCHRFADQGGGLGPDLTSVGQRLTRPEILQSILFPSHVVSQQYASQTLITNSGRAYSGLAEKRSDGNWIVLQANGETVPVAADQVGETAPHRESCMRSGLLDALSLDEIRDLFAFLRRSPTQRVAEQPSGTDAAR